MTSDIYTALQESHKDLHQWFLFHQESLLLFDLERAEVCLQSFKKILLLHLEFENTSILAKIPEKNDLQWQPRVYLSEHTKILKLLGGIEVLFHKTKVLEGRELRLMILELLDKELSFYHLLEHHEEREEKDLFIKASADISQEDFELWMANNASLLESLKPTKTWVKEKLEKA